MAIHFKLLTFGQVLNFLTRKPPSIKLVLTGRRAAKQLIEKADLVTEMIEVKHYYRQNIWLGMALNDNFLLDFLLKNKYIY